MYSADWLPAAANRSQEHEEVRVAGDARAQVALGPLAVDVEDAAPVAAAHAGGAVVRHLEPGPVHDRVHRVLGPVGGDDAVLAHLDDGVGDHVDVRLRERRQVVVAEDRALAADAVVRREPCPQRRVGHLAAQLPAPHALVGAREALVDEDDQAEALEHPVQRRAQPLAQRRQALQQPPLHRRGGPVEAGQDPRRRALEDQQALDLGLDAGDELHRRGTGADDRDTLPGERVAVVPVQRVEARAGEAVQAGDVGHDRRAEGPRGRHQHAGGQGAPVGVEHPVPGLVVPARFAQLASRTAPARARRARRRPRAGRRGSRAAARRSATSPGWARTSTSTAARARRRRSPGRCCRARCRRSSRPGRGS